MEGMTIIQEHAKAQELFFSIQSIYQQHLLRALSGPAALFQETLPITDHSPSVWDIDDLVEMIEGKISTVLGEEFKPIDNYELRVRLPLPPFLFVTRVTQLKARKGEMKLPATLTFEYDIPQEGLFVYGNRLLEIVAAEAGHAVLLLLSYMGCDFQHKGDICFRILSSTFTFSQETPIPPGPGKTIEGVITIGTITRMGATQLVYYDYHCRIDGIDYLTCTASGGFFNRHELDALLPSRDDGMKKNPALFFDGLQEEVKAIPFLSCNKQEFSRADLSALCRGDFLSCFGEDYVPDSFFSLGPSSLLMIEKIEKINRKEGRFGLGEINASYSLNPDHWIFRAHFKNDPVFPGTFMAMGCYQLAVFYMLYLGWHKLGRSQYYSILRGNPAKIRFLGEVRPGRSTLFYQVHIKSVSGPRQECTAEASVFHENKCVLGFQDFGVALFR